MEKRRDCSIRVAPRQMGREATLRTYHPRFRTDDSIYNIDPNPLRTVVVLEHSCKYHTSHLAIFYFRHCVDDNFFLSTLSTHHTPDVDHPVARQSGMLWSFYSICGQSPPCTDERLSVSNQASVMHP